MAVLKASMLVIGDELLGGYVADRNTPVVARILTPAGVPLERVHTIPDTHEAIDEALTAELGRDRPRLVVTSGGIGSTPDDITFEAVAASLGRELVTEPTIANRLEAALGWQEQLGVEITEPLRTGMLRMSRIPDGARLLGDEGFVPGLRVDVDGGVDADDGATIVILPGIPREFERIMHDLVAPVLIDGRNPVPAVAEVEHGLPESMLNPMFAQLEERFPDVKLGSYPGMPMLIRLSGTPDTVAGAESFVQAQLDDIMASEGGAAVATAWSNRMGRRT